MSKLKDNSESLDRFPSSKATKRCCLVGNGGVGVSVVGCNVIRFRADGQVPGTKVLHEYLVPGTGVVGGGWS